MIDDPKKRLKPIESDAEPPSAEPSMAAVMARLTDVLAEMKAAQSGDQKEAALKQAELMERLLIKTQPENPQCAGISAFWTLEDKAQYGTKPTLRCKTIWAGRELYGDVETPEEILLINQLPHGDFKVTKADGNKVKFQVRHKLDDNGNLEEVNVWFPCKGIDKHNHRGMVSYCQQVLGLSEPSMAELEAEVARLRAELASAKVGVLSA